MARPFKRRRVCYNPEATYFKPRSVPLSELDEVNITLDELETLRLTNLEGLRQEEAATRMEIHQSTFQRTLTRAREKVTDALVNGKAIKLGGGPINGGAIMPQRDGTGPDGEGPRTGRGMGKCRGEKPARWRRAQE